MRNNEVLKELGDLLESITVIKGTIIEIFFDEYDDHLDDFYFDCYNDIEERISRLNRIHDFYFFHPNHFKSKDSLIHAFNVNSVVSSDIRIWTDGLYDSLIDQINYYFGGNDLHDSYWKIIHPEIIQVSKTKFDDGHFADSVESAFKELNIKIKDIYKSKTNDEKDGKDLMAHAFKLHSNNTSCIELGDLSTRDGKNQQEGYQLIFMGVMQAIRNPKAHNNLIITKEDAIHGIFLSSKLMYVLDGSKY